MTLLEVRRRLASRTAAALLAVGASDAAVAAPPTVHSITIDGSFVDWADILNNPVDVAIDGVGAGVRCGLSDDLDCPVTNAGDVVLSWDAAPRDACTRWEVHVAGALPILDHPTRLVFGGLLAASVPDDTAAAVPLRLYLVRATSAIGGPGPLTP